MQFILVFDDSINIEKIGDHFIGDQNRVIICPLSANFSLLNCIKEKLVAAGQQVEIVNIANLLDDEVKLMRSRFTEWSAGIGNIRVGRKKRLIDAFKLPGHQVSTWWFGLLSEKNPFKTDAFYQIALVNALKKIFRSSRYDACSISVDNDDLCYAIARVAEHEGISLKVLRPRDRGSNNRLNWRYLRGTLQKMGIVGMFLLGFTAWLEVIIRAVSARRIMGDRSKRMPSFPSLLFVSYFPAVDQEHLKNGKFRNRYTATLQDKLTDMNMVVTWVMICASIDGYSYHDAVRLAKRFARGGEKLFIIEEFLTIKDAMAILWMWLRQAVLSIYLLGFTDTPAYEGIVGEESRLIFRKLWHSSFCGEIAVEGIIFYYLFRRIFSELSAVDYCIYLCEMHAWEKALNAGKENSKSDVKTIGFQYAAVSRNYLNYFYHRSETIRSHDPLQMPLPDILACNGKLNQSLFESNDYPCVRGVEAVRQMYLKNIISLPVPSRPAKPILLVAGSIDQKESTALISLVHGAYPHADDIDIWFKGHPVMPFEGLFEKEKIDKTKTGYFICHDNIADCLKKAWAVLVPTSTVAIEALAFGCEVIVPVFPNSILMNPLADYELFYQRVTTPEELKDVLDKIAERGFPADMEARRAFIEDYFFLNPSLSRWENLLTSPNGRADCPGRRKSLREQ